MKNNKLKSISSSIILAIVIAFCAASCSYDDFVKNEFDYTSVYLPQPEIDRTFIMGEGMRIGVGVVLGGRLSNTKDVEVTFSLDETLLTPGTELPNNYYELVDENGNPANNKIIIPAGKVQGFVYVKADSINYLNDPISLGHNYSLGFRIDNVVSADSILSNLNTTVINFSYINQLYGFYVQTGTLSKDGVESVYSENDLTTNEIELTMLNPNTLITSRIGDLSITNDQRFHIVVADDNTISIQTADGGIAVNDDQGSFYNPETRDITLNYSFEFNGISYVAREVLKFRNRIVDGVNQIGI